MHKSLAALFLFIAITFSCCVEVTRPYDKIPPGVWRAELQIKNDVILPFNFESMYDDDNDLKINLLNAQEKIPVSDITFGRTKDLRDTLVISFPLMDSYISATFKENVMEGYWHVNYREDYQIPFVAFHGQAHRFSTDQIPPAINLNGKWEASFEVETEDVYPAVGEFVQNENAVTGTFLTETGDYRFLEGSIQGSNLYLSCFDGGHAFLFTAKADQSENLTGTFYSGKHYETNWVARKNENAQLTDPYQLSQIVTPDKSINFSLLDSDGNEVSLDDDHFKGKPKLITIMGTWCPNCLDESKFLLEYVQNNTDLSLEIIAIAFEKYRDEDKALSTIRNYKNRLNIPYPILYGGYYDKAEATSKLGFIDRILSYPTLLFVDRNNIVRKVHTGFNGPATSKYEQFKDDFEQSVQLIL